MPQAQPVAKRKREESFAWDTNALSTEREEVCFEEVRSQPAVFAWTSQKAEGAAKEWSEAILPCPDQLLLAACSTDCLTLAACAGEGSALAEQAPRASAGTAALPARHHCDGCELSAAAQQC